MNIINLIGQSNEMPVVNWQLNVLQIHGEYDGNCTAQSSPPMEAQRSSEMLPQQDVLRLMLNWHQLRHERNFMDFFHINLEMNQFWQQRCEYVTLQYQTESTIKNMFVEQFAASVEIIHNQCDYFAIACKWKQPSDCCTRNDTAHVFDLFVAEHSNWQRTWFVCFGN